MNKTMKTKTFDHTLQALTAALFAAGCCLSTFGADLVTGETTYPSLKETKRLVRTTVDYDDAGNAAKITLVERNYFSEGDHARQLFMTTYDLSSVTNWAGTKTNDVGVITTNGVKNLLTIRFEQANVAAVGYTNILRRAKLPQNEWMFNPPPPAPPVEEPPVIP